MQLILLLGAEAPQVNNRGIRALKIGVERPASLCQTMVEGIEVAPFDAARALGLHACLREQQGAEHFGIDARARLELAAHNRLRAGLGIRWRV